MRRLLYGHSAASRGATSPDGTAQGSQTSAAQDHTLGLMHLRKLFAELKQPPAGATQNELENMLYNMLPLFCKVCMRVTFTAICHHNVVH